MANPNDMPSPYLMQTAPGTPAYPIGLGQIPVPERMTFQREANELVDQIARAHALMDQFSPAPSSGNQNAALLPLGQALAASREQMSRLLERLDGLFSAVGQI